LRKRTVVFALFLFLTAFMFSGCGDRKDLSEGLGAAELLVQSAARANETKSVNFDGILEVNGEGVASYQGRTVTGEGFEQYLTIRLQGRGDGPFELSLYLKEQDVYLKDPNTGSWVSAKGNPMMAQVLVSLARQRPYDPAQAMEGIKNSIKEAQFLEDNTLGKIPVKVISVVPDMEKALDNFPGLLPPQTTPDLYKDLGYEVWVGKHDLLPYRYVLYMTLDIQEMGEVDLVTRMDFTGYNQVTIELPSELQELIEAERNTGSGK